MPTEMLLAFKLFVAVLARGHAQPRSTLHGDNKTRDAFHLSKRLLRQVPVIATWALVIGRWNEKTTLGTKPCMPLVYHEKSWDGEDRVKVQMA